MAQRVFFAHDGKNLTAFEFAIKVSPAPARQLDLPTQISITGFEFPRRTSLAEA